MSECNQTHCIVEHLVRGIDGWHALPFAWTHQCPCIEPPYFFCLGNETIRHPHSQHPKYRDHQGQCNDS